MLSPRMCATGSHGAAVLITLSECQQLHRAKGNVLLESPGRDGALPLPASSQATSPSPSLLLHPLLGAGSALQAPYLPCLQPASQMLPGSISLLLAALIVAGIALSPYVPSVPFLFPNRAERGKEKLHKALHAAPRAPLAGLPPSPGAFITWS